MTNWRVIRSDPRDDAGDYSYEEIEIRQSPSTREYGEDGVISKLVSNAVIHALEALLTALLSPIMVWQWLSKHDHFMMILRVVFEVALELIMLIVFAGVSILTAATLIFEDVYSNETVHTRKAIIAELHDENERKAREKPINARPIIFSPNCSSAGSSCKQDEFLFRKMITPRDSVELKLCNCGHSAKAEQWVIGDVYCNVAGDIELASRTC